MLTGEQLLDAMGVRVMGPTSMPEKAVRGKAHGAAGVVLCVG